MAVIVVPFRGLAGKQRLTGLGADTHRAVVLGMLADVLAATTLGGIALVASADGRTNALSLPAPNVFDPLYGPRSARRFQRSARDLGLETVVVAIPNLADDVDTAEDLDRLQLRAGRHTQAALQGLRLAS